MGRRLPLLPDVLVPGYLCESARIILREAALNELARRVLSEVGAPSDALGIAADENGSASPPSHRRQYLLGTSQQS